MTETSDLPEIPGLVCPVPLPHQESIVLGHGSGGKLMHDLIARHFYPNFQNPILAQGNDAGTFRLPSPVNNVDGQQLILAVSTDSHVVSPLFFKGGDIGRLSISGTVNDLAMSGAVPLYLTAGFILEEGLDIHLLDQVIISMAKTAVEAGVQVIAGDTKVVQKGKADLLYINTAGIGTLPTGTTIGGSQAKPGDAVLINGTIGDHGIAVLEARGELGFESGIESDVAPLNHMIHKLIQAGIEIHVLRDPTRGGVGTTLNEIAQQSRVGIMIHENSIPVKQAVSAACEMLGLDPLYIANEGKVIVIVAPRDAQRALEFMRAHPYGHDAVQIGEVISLPTPRVLLKTSIGTTRVIDTLSGELLPRIC